MVSEIEKSEGTVDAVECHPAAEANTFTEIFCGYVTTEACTSHPLERIGIRVAVFVERLWGFGIGDIVGFTASSSGSMGNREKG